VVHLSALLWQEREMYAETREEIIQLTQASVTS